MFRLLDLLMPRIYMFADEPAGGPAVEAPPASEPTPEPVVREGGEPEPAAEPKAEPPVWPSKEDVLEKVKKGKEPKEEPKPAEEPAPEPKKEEPKAEPPKKEFAKAEALLVDLIEGLDPKEFEGKTVKDFADYVANVEKKAQELGAFKGIKDILDKNAISEKDFKEFIENKKAKDTETQELKEEDFDTNEEYQEAVKKQKDEQIKEERLQKLEVEAQEKRNKEFQQSLNENIEGAIKRHSDEATKRCLLSNSDINGVLDILGLIPNDVEVDVVSIVNKSLDSIAESKKAYTTEVVKEALEKAKPENIKEYLALKNEQQKQFLESSGVTPAPEFAKPPEPPKGSDLEDGSLKKRVIQMVKERMGKK